MRKGLGQSFGFSTRFTPSPCVLAFMLESVKARCFVYSGLHCYIEFWALILAVRSRCLTSIHVFTRHCGNLNRINWLPLYLFLHLIFWFIFEIGLQFFFIPYIYIIKFLFVFICLFLYSYFCSLFCKLSMIIFSFLFKYVFFLHTTLFISLRYCLSRWILFKDNEKYQNNFFPCTRKFLVRCFTTNAICVKFVKNENTHLSRIERGSIYSKTSTLCRCFFYFYISNICAIR